VCKAYPVADHAHHCKFTLQFNACMLVLATAASFLMFFNASLLRLFWKETKPLNTLLILFFGILFAPMAALSSASGPPRYSIAMVIGFLKGKSAIRIHRELMGHEKNFTGLHFWARGYYVSTVGLNEDEVRKYIREQEEADKKQGDLEFK
jgi:putative transposase